MKLPHIMNAEGGQDGGRQPEADGKSDDIETPERDQFGIETDKNNRK